ncbi:hypothetical protein CAPTEDRAFT_201800 [Capitella teleta]|uniref:C3H1-type domain-containing protein n=1 Tax=Capitella teleta TaxID=283909 RepID=R7U623_CAPTE|nr:hypothetical protein CAPTEDRAFT_201800 [Capitella teleta]|eukprot:ELU01541.1 hypothetical protein CAPTEDRAFT_201800 [Capitella teleta]
MSSVRSRQLISDGVRKQVFSWLVKKHRGCCELSKITKELFPSMKFQDDLLRIINESPWLQQCIKLLNYVDGRDSLAIAFCPKIRLCFTYYREGSCCRGDDCKYIHLCHSKLYYDHCRCTETDNCMATNQTLNASNILKGLSEDEKGIVLRNSLPTVCLGYNSSQDCLNLNKYAMCPYVHVCIEHLRGACKDPVCPWSHTLQEAPHHQQLEYWNEHIASSPRLELRLIDEDAEKAVSPQNGYRVNTDKYDEIDHFL